MRKAVQERVMKIANIIETIIGVLLIISISISVIYLIFDLTSIIRFRNTIESFSNYLSASFSLIIGIEFIKMLSKHTPETVIEVLLFAIARHLIVDHGSSLENLIGIASIAALFAIRKYLFFNFDEVEKTIYRGSERVKRINLLEHIEIPYENKEDTLEDIILYEVESRNLELGVGLCIYYRGFALKVEKIKNNVITRVEIIRSMNKK